MSHDANRATVLAYVAAFNARDEAALRALFTDDAEIHGVLGSGGLEQALPIWRELWAAFAIELRVDGIAADGDVVAVRYTEVGASVGPFRGQAASGRSFAVVAMEWFELRDGRIRRRWGARDTAAEFRQMGLHPL